MGHLVCEYYYIVSHDASYTGTPCTYIYIYIFDIFSQHQWRTTIRIIIWLFWDYICMYIYNPKIKSRNKYIYIYICCILRCNKRCISYLYNIILFYDYFLEQFNNQYAQQGVYRLLIIYIYQYSASD